MFFSQDIWVVRLIVNLLGYATLILPATLLIYYFRKHGLEASRLPLCLKNLIQHFVFGSDQRDLLPKTAEPTKSHSHNTEGPSNQALVYNGLKLSFYFIGLQAMYLSWGVLQERIMTKSYDADGVTEKFTNSQFLVFMNRISACLIAFTWIIFTRSSQPHHVAPLHKYSFASLSNIMSSWCQYEALKFVSFPTQVLSKASKIIPTMLMGKLINRRSYAKHEYITAAFISAGVSVFLLSRSTESKQPNTVTTFSGILLLAGYMVFDSFTSNWQDSLFIEYRVSAMQMMAGINFYSSLLTCVSLWEQGGFLSSIHFMLTHRNFASHVLILSVCSAGGQLFIFYTIRDFGAVVFAIIMAIRQALAILLSCLIYQHPITADGVFGIVIVFSAVFTRIYLNYQMKQAKRLAPALPEKSASPQLKA